MGAGASNSSEAVWVYEMTRLVQEGGSKLQDVRGKKEKETGQESTPYRQHMKKYASRRERAPLALRYQCRFHKSL